MSAHFERLSKSVLGSRKKIFMMIYLTPACTLLSDRSTCDKMHGLDSIHEVAVNKCLYHQFSLSLYRCLSEDNFFPVFIYHSSFVSKCKQEFNWFSMILNCAFLL